MKRTRSRAAQAALTTAAVGTTMLAVVATSGPAAAVTGRPAAHTDSVSVSGHGSAKGTPDTLLTDFDAHARRANATDALNAAGSVASAVIHALETNGVPSRDIQTTSVSVEPHYRHGHRHGFEADESITAKIRPLKSAGQVLDAAANAGGNQLRINDARLTLSNKSTLAAKARANAFASARAAAEQYAGLAGRHLGRVMHITASVHGTGGQRLNIRGSAGAVAAAAPAVIPVNPGRQTVRAAVRVIWAMHR